MSQGAFLTERQREILQYLREFQAERGVAPTHREICEKFNYSSYGTVHKHLRLLREKGYLRRVQHQKRGLELLDPAVNATTTNNEVAEAKAEFGGAGQSSTSKNQSSKNRSSKGPSSEGPDAAEAVALPFLGKIAAGQPIEAISTQETLDVPSSLLGTPFGEASHYILRVAGDSMIDEGIHDGDLVVVQQTDTASKGTMVVALVDGEATLKRFFPEGKQVRLQPSNATMDPILVPADRMRIQGSVVGLMRKY